MPPAADRDLAVITTLPSLSALLRHRAAVQPDERAYVALSDRGQQELWGNREEQTEALRRQRVLRVEGPALDLWVADEGEIRIKDVGGWDRKCHGCGGPAQ